jgi:CO/xanthine dehydrogenase FAD-binding subunit
VAGFAFVTYLVLVGASFARAPWVPRIALPIIGNGLPRQSNTPPALGPAAALLIEDGRIARAHLALGGVGTVPWRARRAEVILNGAPATDETFRAAAEAALADPFTVPGTAFKVELAKRTIVRILQTVSGVQS